MTYRRIEIPELQGKRKPWEQRALPPPIQYVAVQVLGYSPWDLDRGAARGQPMIVLASQMVPVETSITEQMISWRIPKEVKLHIKSGQTMMRVMGFQVELPPDLQVTLKRAWFPLLIEQRVVPSDTTLAITLPDPLLRLVVSE